MKKYPIEYSRDEILNKIDAMFNDISDNSKLSKGEKELLLLKIEIGQLFLNAKGISDNVAKLESIIENNNKTVKRTTFLSSLIILIGVVSLIISVLKNTETYKDEMSNIIENNEKIILNLDSIQKLMRKNSYINNKEKNE